MIPALCREILGEELRLPTIASWWCGNSDSLQFVLKNLDQLIFKPAFRRRGHEVAVSQQLNNLTTAELAAIIQANPTALFRVALFVRDRMSTDSWRTIYRIEEEFNRPRMGTVDLTDLLTMTNNVIIDLAAFSGLVMESMTRSQAWRFLDLGRRLERALQTISLVRDCLVELADPLRPVMEAVLEIADSLMTYRSRYLENLQLASVLDLLLTDETNPRSVAFQLVSLADHVEQLPRERAQPVHAPEQRVAMSLLHNIRMANIR